MPRGWHLAQGRALLTRSDNDDDEGPYEITNGQLVCSSHGRVISGMCCTDYSFRDDARRNRTVQAGLAHVTSRGRNSGASSTNAIRQVQVVFTGVAIMSTWDPDGEALCANITPPMLTGREKRRGTGRVFPTEFSPRSDMIKPTELFPGQANYEYPRR
jgi:ribonuclease HI